MAIDTPGRIVTQASDLSPKNLHSNAAMGTPRDEPLAKPSGNNLPLTDEHKKAFTIYFVLSFFPGVKYSSIKAETKMRIVQVNPNVAEIPANGAA